MARNLSEMLPAGWGGYSPSRKIDWFNSVGATVSELETAGVPRSDIDYMIANGFQPGATEKDNVVEDHIAELFRTYLGREPDLEGGNFYERQFGNEVDRDELSRFLYGAVGAGEITQRQASEFLNPVVKEVQGKEVAITPDVQEKIDLYNEYADDGLTNAQILAKAEELFGEQTQEDFDILRDLALQDRVNEEFGGVTQENINDVVKAATDLGLNTEEIAAALGGTVTTAGEQKTLNLNTGQVGKTVAASFSPEEIREYIAATYGRLNQDNINDVIKETTERNIPLEDVVSAIGGNFVTGPDGKQSIQFTPNAALTAFQQAEDQIAQLYRQEFGRAPDAEGLNFYASQLAEGRSLADIQAEIDASEEGAGFDAQLQQLINTQYGGFGGANSQEIVDALSDQGYSLTQIADAIGADIATNEKGETIMSYTPPPPPPKTFTNEQVQKLITDQFGSVTPDNFQKVVDAVIGAGVPVDQFASVIGATLDTNDAGQISLTLPAAAVETQPMSLVDQLKAQQAATGITHQASFSKDQDKIIADMAEKLGKYGVQDLADLKPITGEIEYQLEERLDNGEPTGVFNLMQLGIGPEGEEQWQYAGRAATPDEINQIRTKGTVTENVGVLNARTGEEIPLNKLNNAEGSGFTYYKIEFSPDGIAVPYGYKEATGAGALGDQIKSIVSIPPVAAALAAVTAGAVGPEGLQLVASKPVAAAIGAGTVGYAGSGRLDTAAKAAATAFTVSYALQALGVDLTADQSARVDAVKDVPGYSSLTRTVDLGGGLTYDPVSNSILDANFGTSLNAATGDIEFPDGSIATAKDYGIYPSAEAAPPGATVTPVSPGSPIVSANLPAASQNTVTITGSQVPELSALSGLPVGTRLLNPLTGNPAEITITADGVKQLTNISALAAGVQTLGPGATAQVNVTETKPGATQAGTAGVSTGTQALGPGTTAQVNVDAVRQGTDQGGAAAGAVQNVSGGNTAQVDVAGTKTDTGSLGSGLTGYEFVTDPITGNTKVVKVTKTKQDTGTAGAGAGAVATTKGVLSSAVGKVTGNRLSELTSDEIEALVKAGLLTTMLLGGGTDSPTTPTTTIDTAAINTLRPGFNVDLGGAPGTVTPKTPGQTVYTNLGINTGKPTTTPTTPTSGIGSIPVPTYKPPPFLGSPAPGASRIVSPVVTADPTITQADFDAAALDIAAQQAALPPIVQPVPTSPFESGLAKGTEVGMRRGGLAALYAGGPVTGSPQYFAEGGETMRKYAPSELGSTFDVSEYIDPRTGKFKAFEYERDVVYSPNLKAAEAEERLKMQGASREEIEAIIEEILSRNEKKMAYGGMTGSVNQPRMLAGGGDGMSDSIPATIDGTQPARLADGEFVIPADVVADIGNGSSRAGAKQLYAMMDRVRESRHGTTKQPPEVNMKKVLPV